MKRSIHWVKCECGCDINGIRPFFDKHKIISTTGLVFWYQFYWFWAGIASVNLPVVILPHRRGRHLRNLWLFKANWRDMLRWHYFREEICVRKVFLNKDLSLSHRRICCYIVFRMGLSQLKPSNLFVIVLRIIFFIDIMIISEE